MYVDDKLWHCVQQAGKQTEKQAGKWDRWRDRYHGLSHAGGNMHHLLERFRQHQATVTIVKMITISIISTTACRCIDIVMINILSPK